LFFYNYFRQILSLRTLQNAAFEGIFSYTPTPALLHLAKPQSA